MILSLVTVTVTGKKCEVSLAAVNYVWLHKAAYQDDSVTLYDVQSTFKRGALTLTGTLSEEFESDDGKFMRFTFDNGPAFSGSWELQRLYNKKGLENGMRYHKTDTWTYGSSGGYILLQFSKKTEGKLLKASISYLNAGEHGWDWHDTPIAEELIDRRGTEKASAWSATLKPEGY